MEKIRIIDVVATNIPVAHGRLVRDQTIGNLDGATDNYWNAALFIGLRGHSIEKKRI